MAQVKVMTWQEYEREICEELRKLFPESNILTNQRMAGRCGSMRQVDILVRERVAGREINIVVDGKYFSRKVDVKVVESFAGLVRDVRAHKGILVTNVGYTATALKRAQSEEADIDLDVLTPAELERLQGYGAVPYVDSHGVLMPAPFGWVIDGTRSPNMVAALYRRGLSSLEQAQREGELIYINFWPKEGRGDTLEGLLAEQEKDFGDYPPEIKIEMSYVPVTFQRRDGVEMRLRLVRMTRPDEPVLEYTGFVNFPKFIFFAVLLTREATAKRNLGKLEYLMEKVLPLNVVHSSTPVGKMRRR